MDFTTRCWDGMSPMTILHFRLVLGHSELKGMRDGIVIVFPTKTERQSCTLQENAIVILPILVQRFVEREAGSFCGWCQVTAFGYDSPIVYKAPFTKKQLVKPLFPLNKTVLNFQGRTRPSLCCLDWKPSQEGEVRPVSCFYKSKYFFSPSNCCEGDKGSSRQPCDRDEPDHPIKLQYFCVHL